MPLFFPHREVVNNRTLIIFEFSVAAFVLLHEISFTPTFRITDTSYKWNLSVIGTKSFLLEIRIRERQLYFNIFQTQKERRKRKYKFTGSENGNCQCNCHEHQNLYVLKPPL